jgi:hypothetical protein
MRVVKSTTILIEIMGIRYPQHPKASADQEVDMDKKREILA